MKVALVTPRFAVSDAYGGEVSVALLADMLTARGVDVRVIAEDVDASDDRVMRVPFTPRSIAEALQGVDVAHVYNMNALFAARAAARRARVPAVVTANSYWATCLFADMSFPNGDVCPGCHVAGVQRDYATRNPRTVGRRVPAPVGRAVVARRTRALAAYPAVIALSEASKRQFASAGVPPERVTVIPNMADPKLLSTAAREVPASPHVLFVGALKHTKGPHVLLDALPTLAARLPDVRVTLAGDGPEREPLEARAARLGVTDRVTFAGRVPYDALTDLYRSASAVAFPVVWEEPFGRVMLEAFAHGVPVVASDRGGPGEVIRDGENGRSCPAEDADALAFALADVLEDPENGARLVDGGRRTLEAHAPDTIVPRIIRVYESVTGRA